MPPPRGSYARRRITGCCALYDLPDPARADYYLFNVVDVFEKPFLSISTPLWVG